MAVQFLSDRRLWYSPPLLACRRSARLNLGFFRPTGQGGSSVTFILRYALLPIRVPDPTFTFEKTAKGEFFFPPAQDRATRFTPLLLRDNFTGRYGAFLYPPLPMRYPKFSDRVAASERIFRDGNLTPRFALVGAIPIKCI